MRKDLFGERYAPLTIDDLEAMDKATISPKEAASVLGCIPYYLNVKARAGTLEFPTFFSGNRLKILREPFIKWVRGR